MQLVIREMKDSDWLYIESIYSYAILEVQSTFCSIPPSFKEWDEAHHKNCRFVACFDDVVVGFCTLMPVSSKELYKGVCEVSLYVDLNHRFKQIGYQLLQHMVDHANEYGYWSIYSAIFSNNVASIKLHKKCGFREIGYREKLAKDRHNRWRDVTMLELRYKDE